MLQDFFPSYIFFTLVNKTQFIIWFDRFPDEELITERNVLSFHDTPALLWSSSSITACQECINGLVSIHSEYLTSTDTNDSENNVSRNEKTTAAKCHQRKIEDEPKAKESSLSVSRVDKDGGRIEPRGALFISVSPPKSPYPRSDSPANALWCHSPGVQWLMHLGCQLLHSCEVGGTERGG